MGYWIVVAFALVGVACVVADRMLTKAAQRRVDRIYARVDQRTETVVVGALDRLIAEDEARAAQGLPLTPEEDEVDANT